MRESAVKLMKQGAIQPVGTVWTLIRKQGEDLAHREPPMRRMLLEQVVSSPDSMTILARVLASRLAVAAAEFEPLTELFEDILQHDQQLADAVEADLLAVRERDPACQTYLHALLNLKGFQGLQTYRIANKLWSSGRTEVAIWLSNLGSLVFGIDIHPAARLGSSIMLDHGTGIVIGETAVVGNGVSILQNVTLGGTGKETGNRHPKIEDGVMIGASAKILGNIKVGAYSIVAAGSVVLRDVPSRSTVAGVPAKVVRRHRADESPAQSMDQRM